jgi:CRISPR-associated endonuclease/helicase Cas3
MTNPMEFTEELNIPEQKRFNRCPVILITNPDLFYYALYSCYNNLDKRNIFETMLSGFEYIIIDEFHYYNSKQLANFLFFLALSLEFGYFESENRKVCLLSATPDAQVYRYLERLALQGL